MPSRSSSGSMSSWKPHRDDGRVPARHQLGEARTKRDVLGQEGDDFLQRSADRGHLDRDHLAKREAPADLGLHLDEDVVVAELLDGHDGACRRRSPCRPSRERRACQRATRCSSVPIPSISSATVSPAFDPVACVERRPGQDVAGKERGSGGSEGSRRRPLETRRVGELVRRDDDWPETESEVTVLRGAEPGRAPLARVPVNPPIAPSAPITHATRGSNSESALWPCVSRRSDRRAGADDRCRVGEDERLLLVEEPDRGRVQHGREEHAPRRADTRRARARSLRP